MESLSVRTKKFLYIGLFTVLGVMISFILRGIIEYTTIELLIGYFEYFNLGLSWDQWFQVHSFIMIFVLPSLFAILGFYHGRHAWREVYGDLEESTA